MNPNKGQNLHKRATSHNDSYEFLKIIKKSEYKVVDQLNQTPSKISILSRLLSYEAYHEAPMNVLNESNVTKDTTMG